MGRELQKKKKRSSIPKVKHKPKSKHLRNPRGNAIIAANWNQNETLSQNYKRLGLTTRLNRATGGIEKLPGSKYAPVSGTAGVRDGLSIKNAQAKTMFEPKEVRVERDPATGKILRVIRDEEEEQRRQRRNPLGDLLVDSSDEGDEYDEGAPRGEAPEQSGAITSNDHAPHKGQTAVVRLLEQQAACVAPKQIRSQSAREREWIEHLVAKYGEDYARMARDRKLNPMQQTEADIRRRVDKWRSEDVREEEVSRGLV